MRRYFEFVTNHPYPVLATVALVAGVLGLYMFGLTRETHPDAFIPSDHPALLIKAEIDEKFDLSDPLVIGVIRDAEHGIFTESTITLIRDLTIAIQELPQVDSSGVMSLATESGVYFDEDGEPGFDFLLTDIPTTRAGLDSLRRDILSYELYRGTLVAADASAGAIIIRVDDDAQAEALYHRLGHLLDSFPTTTDVQLIVTGEAAVRAHMGTAVSDDALRMNFICPIVMALLIILAYRTLRGAVLPLCVIGGASALAMGLMSLFEVPVFIVTNGIFVIIMALGVADSLHLVGQYYEEQLAIRGRDHRTLIVDACMALWYPVLITTLTDIAGFFALYITGVMPPIRYFGLFTCIGVAGALIYSLTIIPAGLAVLPLRSSRAFKFRTDQRTDFGSMDQIGRAMAWLGGFVYRKRIGLLVIGAVVIGVAIVGAFKLVVNDSRLLAFKDDHPMVLATEAFNERFDGTSQLNIVLSSNRRGGIVNAQTLEQIDSLEAFTERLPHVGGTHSLVGWIKRAHQKLNQDDPAFFAIPTNPRLTSFYLNVLRAPSSPMSRMLSEVVDHDYSTTNLIVRMTSSEYIHQRETITLLEAYLDKTFDSDSLKVQLAGRVNLDYHWLGLVKSTHVRSVVFSILCVLLLTGVMFRSLVAGLLCTFTVAVAVLVNYAVMGFGGIGLGVGTAMFASIAIGAGVNFPIHLLDRLRLETRTHTDDSAKAIQRAVAFTGRALFFTAFVVALGFALLTVSEFRTLVRFGLLIAIAMMVSFIVSVTLLPAIVAVCKPRFIYAPKK